MSCPARPSQSPPSLTADSRHGRVATHPDTEEVRAREVASEPIMLPILRTREGVRTRAREGASEPIRRRRSPRAGLRSVLTPSALPLSGPAALPRSRVDPVDGEPCCGPYAAVTGRSCHSHPSPLPPRVAGGGGGPADSGAGAVRAAAGPAPAPRAAGEEVRGRRRAARE